MNPFIKDVSQFSANNYNPLPIVLARGRGVWVTDTSRKKYLDCLAAYSALNQGHRHPKIIAALKKQADRLTIGSRAFHNDQMGIFLKNLCAITKMEMALPMNTGAEAVETAIKAARKWGYRTKKVPHEKAEIIVCENNFHGRTTTIVGFSSEQAYRADFGPFTPGFRRVPFGDAKALKAAITKNTVGFLLEPIQGEAGVLIPPPGYLSQVKAICEEHNVLLLLDEIQTGLGRTGKMFCFQHEKNAKPDILILGKALGGGVYPVSAVTASREVLGLFRPGEHGSTFGGNPLASAVAIASLNVLVKENLSQRSADLGQYFLSELKKIRSPHVAEVRGKGLMIAIEIRRESGPARPFCERLSRGGILSKETHDQVIRLTPPLVIKKSEIDWLLKRLGKVLAP